MTRKKPQNQNVVNSAATQESNAPKEKTVFLHTNLGKRLPYLLTFIASWIFCTFTYGDVFSRTVQESFVCGDTESMKFLTSQENGDLYYWGRYLLLVFHNKWIGGLALGLLLTATARLLDYALRIPKWLRGVSALVPFGLMLLWVNEGIKIYYRSEPSLFILQAVGVFSAVALLALISKLLLSKFFPSKAIITPTGWKRWSIGSLLVVLTFIPLNFYTWHTQENTILTAKMQNHILANEMSPLIEEGLSAKQPTRSVAAYYAIGLLQNNELLEHIFDISFNFPDIHLVENDGSGEYGIFTADCNFFAGLINASYRSAMDQTVMAGPRLYYLKRMAICSILNREDKLANKYLNLVAQVPFEKDFVETYQPMVGHPELVGQHPIFSKVLALAPVEQRFEQNYRNPAFMGYNIGMMQGSNAALAPSIAACLYSKDLPNMSLRAVQYKNMTGSLPLSMQEALYIHSRKHPEILHYFPELNDNGKAFMNPATTNVSNFFLTIQDAFQERYNYSADWRERMSKDLKNGIPDDLRKKLEPEWLGHYVYYYYCENVVQKAQVKTESHGVN